MPLRGVVTSCTPGALLYNDGQKSHTEGGARAVEVQGRKRAIQRGAWRAKHDRTSRDGHLRTLAYHTVFASKYSAAAIATRRDRRTNGCCQH